MTEVLVVVGARLNSSRLPEKHLLPLAGKPLIERLFERLESISKQPRIVLGTTSEDFNRPLVEWALSTGRNYYAYEGKIDDLVGRINAIFEEYQPQCLVYVCGDCPLVHPPLIEALVGALLSLKKKDRPHQAGVVPDPEKRGTAHEGIHVYSDEGWRLLEAASVTPLDREHVGLADRRNRFLSTVEVGIPESHRGIAQRFSVDTAADYFFQKIIYERWYDQHSEHSIVDLDWVLDQLRADPELGAINAHVMQKSAFRQYGKALFVTEASHRKGLGQLRRTVVLAERFQEESGMGTEIWVLGENVELDWLRFTWQRWFSSESALHKALSIADASLVVADIWPERAEDKDGLIMSLRRLRDAATCIVGIDRMYSLAQWCDQVIVPSFYLPEEPPDNVAYGKEYLIVPRQLPIGGGEHDELVSDLLVLTGGGDAFGYGVFLPEVLDQALPEGTKIIWVQGPFADIPDLPPEPRCQWHVRKAPGNLSEALQRAKTVVCVYGVSLIEALAACRPTVVLPAPGVLDEEELRAFELLDLAKVWHQPGFDDTQCVRDIVDCEPVRAEMEQKLREIDLGAGTAQVTQTILAALKKSSTGKESGK